MKKLSAFFGSLWGKITLVLIAILVAYFGIRQYYRGVELERLKQILIANNNWGEGLQDGKTWEGLAQFLYDLKKKNGQYEGFWWA